MRLWHSIACAALLLGCGADTASVAPAVSVNGKWSGPATFQYSGTTSTGTLTLSLSQTGAQVSGTTDDSDTIIGTLTGSSLSVKLTGRQRSQDDCALYPVTLELGVGTDALTAKSAVGLWCKGNGTGGHSVLAPISTASGTLKRQ